MLKEVSSRRNFKSFLYFPFWLYANDILWQPTQVDVEEQLLKRKNNPFYQYGDAKLFLVMKDRRVAGRVAVFANHHELESTQKVLRFGFLDYENDKEVFAQLMQAITDAAEEVGATKLVSGRAFVDVLWGINGKEITKTQQVDQFKPDHVFRQLQRFGFDVLDENPTVILDIDKSRDLGGGSDLKKLNATDKLGALQSCMNIAPDSALFLSHKIFRNNWEIYSEADIYFLVRPEKTRQSGFVSLLKTHKLNLSKALVQVFSENRNDESIRLALDQLTVVLAQQGVKQLKISGLSNDTVTQLQPNFLWQAVQHNVVLSKELN